MHKKHPLAALAIATSLSAGCAGEANDAPEQIGPVEIESHEQSLITFPTSGWHFTYQRVQAGPLRICISFRPSADTTRHSTHQANVNAAVQTWVLAAQAVSNASLFPTPTFTCTDPHLRVIVYPESARGAPPADTNVESFAWDREYAKLDPSDGGRPYVRLFDLTNANIVLHEFGHVFGLHDTSNGTAGVCKAFQPNSVMCDPRFSTLQPDDINGAHEAFTNSSPPPVSMRRFVAPSTPLVGDFDNDGKRDDIAVWSRREGVGSWSVMRENGEVLRRNIVWGLEGHVPLVGDFDGDGFSNDLGTWSQFDGQWHALRLNGSLIFTGLQWGLEGDIPLVGDFDADGKVDDLGVFRPSNGFWYARRTDGSVIFAERQLGQRGDIPLVSDFDSDDKLDDIAVFRPSTGQWWARRDDGTVIFREIFWGTQGDIPLVGDFDEDGQHDDWAVYRRSEGKWYATRRGPQDGIAPPTAYRIYEGLPWGVFTDIPVVGDFDGDGRFDDLAAYRPSEKNWYTRTRQQTTIYVRFLDGFM
jgi:hypothetical protein